MDEREKEEDAKWEIQDIGVVARLEKSIKKFFQEQRHVNSQALKEVAREYVAEAKEASLKEVCRRLDQHDQDLNDLNNLVNSLKDELSGVFGP